MNPLFDRLRRIASMMVGMPDYDAYLQHMREHHPDATPMDRTQFFRERQESRYGGRNGGKCC